MVRRSAEILVIASGRVAFATLIVRLGISKRITGTCADGPIVIQDLQYPCSIIIAVKWLSTVPNDRHFRWTAAQDEDSDDPLASPNLTAVLSFEFLIRSLLGVQSDCRKRERIHRPSQWHQCILRTAAQWTTRSVRGLDRTAVEDLILLFSSKRYSSPPCPWCFISLPYLSAYFTCGADSPSC
jgi:hypothetical protein